MLGDIITQSITLYVFDPNADPNCLANSVDLVIDIHPKPSVPTLTSIMCVGVLGAFFVTDPIGPEYQYQLDASNAQLANFFGNIPNGTHTITVINTVTNCQESVTLTSKLRLCYTCRADSTTDIRKCVSAHH